MPPAPSEATLPVQRPVVSLTLAYVAGFLLGFGALHFPFAAGFLVIAIVLTARLLAWLEKDDANPRRDQTRAAGGDGSLAVERIDASGGNCR